MLDAQGQPILTIMNKMLSFPRAWKITSGPSSDGQQIALVQSRLAFLGAKIDVMFANTADNRPVTLQLRGDWLAMYETIFAFLERFSHNLVFQGGGNHSGRSGCCAYQSPLSQQPRACVWGTNILFVRGSWRYAYIHSFCQPLLTNAMWLIS